MTEILAELKPEASKLSPGQFARRCGDFDFNGQATLEEMTAFWQLACDSFKNKKNDTMLGRLRGESVQRLKGLLGLKGSEHFPRLDVKIVFYQVVLRLLSPQRVNQMNFGLCGPIHFTVMVLKSQPNKYVDFVSDLLTKGFSVGADGTTLRPNKDIKGFDPSGAIPQADWLVAGSLFNGAKVPKVADKQGEFGGTRGPDVSRYCAHFGFSRYVQLTTYEDSWSNVLDKMAHKTVLTKSYEEYHPDHTRLWIDNVLELKGKNFVDPEINIRLAQALVGTGWRVLLKINSTWGASEDTVDLQKRVMDKYADNYKTYEQIYKGEDLEKQWEAFKKDKVELEKRGLVKEKEKIIKSLETTNYVLKVLPVPSANHWVMAKSLAINDEEGTIRLTIYTWGGKREPMVVPLQSFLKGYSGFVATLMHDGIGLPKGSQKDSGNGASGNQKPPPDPLLNPSNQGRVVRVNPNEPANLDAILKQDEEEAEQARLVRQKEAPKKSSSVAKIESPKQDEASEKGTRLLGSHYYTEEDMYALMNHYVGNPPGVVVLPGIGEYQFSRLGPAAYSHAYQADINDATTHTILQPLNVHGNHWALLYIRLGAADGNGIRPARVLYIDPLNPGDVPDLSPLRRAFPQLEVERSNIRYQDDGEAQHSCGAWIVCLSQCLVHFRDVVPPAEDDPQQAAIELRQMHQEVLDSL